MNRNVESHFALNPTVDINRSRFDRSCDIKTTFNVGDLVPFYVDEVLPGDTFEVETSKVVRLQTLLTPVMDNIYLDTYFFFVPYRLVWNHWKEFMGENTESAWLPETTYSIPQMLTKDTNGNDTTGFASGSRYDYMGLPVGVPGLSVSALPMRAYSLIYDQWFRDENLKTPVNLYLGDSNTVQSSASADNTLWKVGKYHDYFTSCLPAPWRAESPAMAPITGSVNATGTGSTILPVNTYTNTHEIQYPMSLWNTQSNSSGASIAGTNIKDSNDNVIAGITRTTPGNLAPNNLWVQSNAIASSLGVDIPSLRNAFQVQKFLERSARSGSRYTEVIAGHFGVQSPDSRLQRAEYLGGNRIPISVHQIINQSQSTGNALGDVGAMSLTTDQHDDFIQSFTEHGVVIGVMCARYDHSYPQGIERFWSRKTMFDYYFPEFANISEQAVLNKEIYAQGTSADDEVFGYQEAWADYRYKPNRVTGEMRPGINNSLASWHFADYYTTLPTLSASWINEDKTNVDRTLAVTSTNANQIFCDIYVKNLSTRPMPTYSIPGLADHY